MILRFFQLGRGNKDPPQVLPWGGVLFTKLNSKTLVPIIDKAVSLPEPWLQHQVLLVESYYQQEQLTAGF